LIDSPLYTIVLSGYPELAKQVLGKISEEVKQNLLYNPKVMTLQKLFPVAVEQNNNDVVSMILSLRASAGATVTGKEALLVAAENRNTVMIETLLSFGAAKLPTRSCKKLSQDILKLVVRPERTGGWWEKKKKLEGKSIEILCLGDKQVGKKTFLSCSSNSPFDSSKIQYFTRQRAGKDFDFTVTVQNSLAPYDKAEIILLFFDLTRESTFNTIENWIKKISQTATMPMFLISTKSDKKEKSDKQEKLLKRISEYQHTHQQLSYFETSAILNINVFAVLGRMEDKIQTRNTMLNRISVTKDSLPPLQ